MESEAYHWSITQLTPAGCEIYPESARERIFSIAVILFGCEKQDLLLDMH